LSSEPSPGGTIGTQSISGRTIGRVDADNERSRTIGSAGGRASRKIGDQNTRTRAIQTQPGISTEQKDLSIRERSVAPLTGTPRTSRKIIPQEQTTIVPDRTIGGVRTDATRLHRYEAVRPSRVVYHDRPHLISHSYHNDYVYRDHYDRIRSRTIWPRYRFAVCYDYGPWFSFRYVYPYYHRKYLFISLGGYWPLGYRYTRYYWYGCHPYDWYGYYPIAREVSGTTYNYYTYNYYTDDDGYQPTRVVNSEIFENLAKQTAEPQEATLADVYFEEAVKAFELAQYNTAAAKFAQAVELAPEDMILPFAYAQALLASEQYSKAAEFLRGALAKVSPEKEGVFFPRGLYPDEESLLKHIDRLAERAAQFSFDADLQLLLGYQLLGIGQHDRAVEPLMQAGRDMVNAKAAAVLLELLEKIKIKDSQPETPAPEKAPVPAPAPASTTIETPAPATIQAPTPAPIQAPAPAPVQIPAPAPIESSVPVASEAVVPDPAPAPTPNKASIQERSKALGGAMVITSLCALGMSAGLGHFVRG